MFEFVEVIVNREVLLDLKDILRSARIKSKFTQEELAKRVGISRETVIAIEKADSSSVGALKVEVAAKWWIACKVNATLDEQSAFAKVVKKVFKIN